MRLDREEERRVWHDESRIDGVVLRAPTLHLRRVFETFDSIPGFVPAERSLVTVLDRFTTALADRYAIEREIGEGGMATVYLARDVRHERQVAIKVLHPQLSAMLGPERFLRRSNWPDPDSTRALMGQHPMVRLIGTVSSQLTYSRLVV